MAGPADEVFVALSAHACMPADMAFPERRFILNRAMNSIPIGRSSKTEAKQLIADVNNGYFDSPIMSRQHAEIIADLDNKKLQIRDKGALHGTFVNDDETKVPVSPPLRLKDGDLIRFGVPVVRGSDTYPPATFKVTFTFKDRISGAEGPSTFQVPNDNSDVDDDDDEDEYDEDDSDTNCPCASLETKQFNGTSSAQRTVTKLELEPLPKETIDLTQIDDTAVNGNNSGRNPALGDDKDSPIDLSSPVASAPPSEHGHEHQEDSLGLGVKNKLPIPVISCDSDMFLSSEAGATQGTNDDDEELHQQPSEGIDLDETHAAGSGDREPSVELGARMQLPVPTRYSPLSSIDRDLLFGSSPTLLERLPSSPQVTRPTTGSDAEFGPYSDDDEESIRLSDDDSDDNDNDTRLSIESDNEDSSDPEPFDPSEFSEESDLEMGLGDDSADDDQDEDSGSKADGQADDVDCSGPAGNWGDISDYSDAGDSSASVSGSQFAPEALDDPSLMTDDEYERIRSAVPPPRIPVARIITPEPPQGMRLPFIPPAPTPFPTLRNEDYQVRLNNPWGAMCSPGTQREDNRDVWSSPPPVYVTTSMPDTAALSASMDGTTNHKSAEILGLKTGKAEYFAAREENKRLAYYQRAWGAPEDTYPPSPNFRGKLPSIINRTPTVQTSFVPAMYSAPQAEGQSQQQPNPAVGALNAPASEAALADKTSRRTHVGISDIVESSQPSAKVLGKRKAADISDVDEADKLWAALKIRSDAKKTTTTAGDKATEKVVEKDANEVADNSVKEIGHTAGVAEKATETAEKAAETTDKTAQIANTPEQVATYEFSMDVPNAPQYPTELAAALARTNSVQEVSARPAKKLRLRKVAEQLGYAALGGVIVGGTVFSYLVNTAPTFA